MKIGGLTWWRYNYGSILQAYALQKELNSIDGVDYEIICQYGKKVASVKNLKEKLSRLGIRKTFKRIIWKFGLRNLRQRNINMQKFIDENLKISEDEYREDTISDANKIYDAFFCGSDQIWNPELTSLDSMYWLGFADASKLKVAYAPSIGVNCLNEEQKKQIIKNLKDFKLISCREESGMNLLNSFLTEKKCENVVDPTLLVERSVWDKISSDKNIYNEKYLYVYMLRGTKKQRKLIEKFAKLKGLKIVTMPFLDNEKIELYDFKFGDIKLWDASPADFISVIRNAEYVFTDSFHCMLFSTMYHKNFFTFPKIGKAQINRMTAFQKLINAESHMISDEISEEEIDKINLIDWNYADDAINKKRKESKEYLKKAFE